MTLPGVVLRALRHRPLATALSALSVALGVGLTVGIDSLRREARSHFEGVATGVDLVVGPKGSPLQIVLFAVFQVDEAPGTLPESVYRALREDPRVAAALPWIVGDSVRGFRIVGTSPEAFGFEARSGAVVRCVDGRPFAAFDAARPAWEAVLGATVAAETGLRTGDSFVATHGLASREADPGHEEAPWKVVGVLEPTGTSFDRVVLIHYEAFYAMEGHDATAGKADAAGRQVSAVLVRTHNPVFTLQLFHEIRAGDEAQPARPLEEVRRLFDIVGSADRLLLAVSVLVVVVAAVGILVSMTNSLGERRRELALVRALGAPRRVVAGLLVAEASAVGALGAAGGILAGHALVAAGAARLTEWSGVRIGAAALTPQDLWFAGGAVLLCAAAGILPAWRAYRVDVAAGLAPSA